MHPRAFITLLVATSSLITAGCASIIMAAAGVGGTIAANHHLGAIAYRTFSEPLPKVRSAVNASFLRMEINPGSSELILYGERLRATAGDCSIEIELEALTPATTRMRVIASREGGMLRDAATAVEIVHQTEKVIGEI